MNAEFYLFDIDHGQCAAVHLPNGRWCIFDVGSRADFSPIEWIIDQAATNHPRFNPARHKALATAFKFEKATISHLHGDHITESEILFKHLKTESFGLRYTTPDEQLLTDMRDSNSETSLPLVRRFLRLCRERANAIQNHPTNQILPPPAPSSTLPSLASLFAQQLTTPRLPSLRELLAEQSVVPKPSSLPSLMAARLTPPSPLPPVFPPVAAQSTLVIEPNLGVVKIRERGIPLNITRKIEGSSAQSRVNNSSIVSRINAFGSSILLCGDLEGEGWEFVLNSRLPMLQQWRELVSGVDILVAPHHGHRSGFSTTLLSLAKPAVVLVSVKSGDENVDSRYSGDMISGICLDGTDYCCITTRQKGHIKVTIEPPAIGQKGQRSWSFGDVTLG